MKRLLEGMWGLGFRIEEDLRVKGLSGFEVRGSGCKALQGLGQLSAGALAWVRGASAAGPGFCGLGFSRRMAPKP